jgi:hypothetical protein
VGVLLRGGSYGQVAVTDIHDVYVGNAIADVKAGEYACCRVLGRAAKSGRGSGEGNDEGVCVCLCLSVDSQHYQCTRCNQERLRERLWMVFLEVPWHAPLNLLSGLLRGSHIQNSGDCLLLQAPTVRTELFVRFLRLHTRSHLLLPKEGTKQMCPPMSLFLWARIVLET